ncbi:Uncharacterized protein MJ1063 [Chlamydiales bacterium SCGC AG-110-M15]|nr:Uncharacterized protein MJ1063 [Chlamydiales bacterium SCGC AG-110-M15]
MKNRSIAFIPVRLSSSRLANKQFKIIGDRPILSWLIHCLKLSSQVDEIVICVTEGESSSELINLIKEENVELFKYMGDENDVVGRMASAAKTYKADICILASGDSPLIPTESLDKLISSLKKHPEGGLSTPSPWKGKELIHQSFIVARRQLWEKADKLSRTAELREHQFPILYSHPEKFSEFPTIYIQDDPLIYDIQHHLSVDTAVDLEFFRKVYRELKGSKKEFSFLNVLRLLQKKPQFKNINLRYQTAFKI